MKLNSLIILISFSIMLMIQSCNNEHEPIAYGGSSESETTISHMVVKFEDKTYETDVKIVGDSVTYLNKEYAELYDSKISVLPELATVMTVGESGVTYVDYLASQEEAENKYKFKNLKNDSVEYDIAATRSKVIDLVLPDESATILAYAELYDDKNFKDTMLKTYAADKGCIYVAALNTLGFNDKCSSIKVFNIMNPNSRYKITYTGGVRDDIYLEGINVFRGYEIRPVLVGHEHTNYGGKKLYCIAPITGSSEIHMDSNLKTIGWNDKISALEWTITMASNVTLLLNGKDSGVNPHN